MTRSINVDKTASTNAIENLVLSTKNPNKYFGKALFSANVTYENSHGKKDFGIIACQAYNENVGKASARIVISVAPKFKIQYHNEFEASSCEIIGKSSEIVIFGVGRTMRMKGNYKVTISDIVFDR